MDIFDFILTLHPKRFKAFSCLESKIYTMPKKRGALLYKFSPLSRRRTLSVTGILHRLKMNENLHFFLQGRTSFPPARRAGFLPKTPSGRKPAAVQPSAPLVARVFS